MDDEAAVNQRVNNRSVRYFDSYRDSAGRPGNRQQPITQFRQTRTAMRKLAFGDNIALRIEQARLVPFRAPIDAGKPC